MNVILGDENRHSRRYFVFIAFSVRPLNAHTSPASYTEHHFLHVNMDMFLVGGEAGGKTVRKRESSFAPTVLSVMRNRISILEKPIELAPGAGLISLTLTL